MGILYIVQYIHIYALCKYYDVKGMKAAFVVCMIRLGVPLSKK